MILLIVWCSFQLLHLGQVAPSDIKQSTENLDISDCRPINECLHCPGVPTKLIQKEIDCSRLSRIDCEPRKISKSYYLPDSEVAGNELGQYVLNITWFPKRIDEGHPSHYVLHMEMLDVNDHVLDTKCVQLWVDWSYVNLSQAIPPLHYACVKLDQNITEPRYLILKIFNLPIDDLICSSTRHRRSGAPTCNVTITKKRFFRLDEQFHRSEICRQSPYPNVSSWLNAEGKIVVKTGPVAAFTKTVKILVRNKIEDKIVFESRVSPKQDSTVFVKTNISESGKYLIIIHFICEDGEEKQSLELDQPILIKSGVDSWTQIVQILVIGGISFLSLLAALFTCLLFWRRSKARSKGPYKVKDFLPPKRDNGKFHSMSVRRSLIVDESRKSVVLALFKPDNPHQRSAILTLVNVLQKIGGRSIECVDLTECPNSSPDIQRILNQFSTGAQYSDVLIFLSNSICRFVKTCTTHKMQKKFDGNSASRYGEHIPMLSFRNNSNASSSSAASIGMDLVQVIFDMSTIRTNSTCRSDQLRFVLHLVSFGFDKTQEDRKREETFVSVFNPSNTIYYKISSLKAGAQVANINEKHTRALVQYAFGVQVVENVNTFIYGEEGLMFLKHVTTAIREPISLNERTNNTRTIESNYHSNGIVTSSSNEPQSILFSNKLQNPPIVKAIDSNPKGDCVESTIGFSSDADTKSFRFSEMRFEL